MSNIYAAPIKELKKYENLNEIKILKYIAEKEGYITNEKIEWRRFYWGFFQFKLLDIIHYDNIKIRFSRRQFKHTYKIKDGRVPIKIYLYLLAIYCILEDYDSQIDIEINEKEKLQTYSEYIAHEIIRYITLIVNSNCAMDQYTLEEIDEFNKIKHDLVVLDNRVGKLMGEI